MRSGSRLPQTVLAVVLSIAITTGVVACVGSGNKAKTPTTPAPIASVTSKPTKPVKSPSPKPTKEPKTEPTKKPVSGGQFNKIFPKNPEGYSLVFSQEKAGFAEAKLKKAGKEVAVLSINDINANPSAIQKFKASKSKVSGYPSVQVGSSQTAILVGDRYQVKVQSKSPDFGVSDRTLWLKKFDLQKLATLK